MKIIRPTDNKDLVIVKEILEQEEYEFIVEFSYQKFYHSIATEEQRAAISAPPVDNSDQEWAWEKHDRIIEKLADSIKKLMIQEYPDFNLEKFIDFGGLHLRSIGSSMEPHTDGPGDIPFTGHGVKSVGALYYPNDNYEGGELAYPELDYVYKPVAGDLIMHKGEEPFFHAVQTVTSGWRFHFGMFGFEHYDADEVIARIKKERPRDFTK